MQPITFTGSPAVDINSLVLELTSVSTKEVPRLGESSAIATLLQNGHLTNWADINYIAFLKYCNLTVDREIISNFRKRNKLRENRCDKHSCELKIKTSPKRCLLSKNIEYVAAHWYNACTSGCYWVEKDLGSSCKAVVCT